MHESCTLSETDKRRALLAMVIEGVAARIVCSVAVTLVFIFKLYKYFAHRLALYTRYWQRCCTEHL